LNVTIRHVHTDHATPSVAISCIHAQHIDNSAIRFILLWILPQHLQSIPAKIYWKARNDSTQSC